MEVGGWKSPSSFYAAQDPKRNSDPFPRPVHPTPGTARWVEAEILAWIERRVVARDAELATQAIDTPPAADPSVPTADPATPPRRKRGRPPGSRNREKPSERPAPVSP
jgi:predicted DNA-binding transcriptional regulator AlpA